MGSEVLGPVGNGWSERLQTITAQVRLPPPVHHLHTTLSGATHLKQCHAQGGWEPPSPPINAAFYPYKLGRFGPTQSIFHKVHLIFKLIGERKCSAML